MLRNILAVIVGWLVGSLVNMGFIMLNAVAFPLAEGLSMSNAEDMAQHVSTLPASGFILVYVAHIGGAFVGAFVAASIAKTKKLVVALVVGAIFLIGGIMAAIQIPSPTLFVILDLVSYLPAAYLGGRIVRGSGL